MSLILLKIESILWGFPTIFLLMFTHIFLSFKLKFPQKNILKGLYYIIKSDKKNTSEGVSSFKSLMTVLAGTLGTGNIIGVSTSICIGGVGSVFWIFISGIFAIATKYAETYIVLKYRKIEKKEKYGGTMYVLRDILGKKKLAIIFAVVTIAASLGVGCMIQANAITGMLHENYSFNIMPVAIIVAILSSYAVFGNEKRISNISSILIPIAATMFIFLNISLLILFKENILSSISVILREAFSLKSVVGGIAGVGIIQVIKIGLSQGLFSNEAGMGSSPIFDATVNEKNLSVQSTISSTTVFLDTVVLCTMTGLVIASSGMYEYTNNPITLINMVFSKIKNGTLILTVSTVIFAIATIPCWSYISKTAVRFLFGNNSFFITIYKFLFIVFIFIGGVTTLNEVWSLSNIANILMIIPNLYMVYKLINEVN